MTHLNRSIKKWRRIPLWKNLLYSFIALIIFCTLFIFLWESFYPLIKPNVITWSPELELKDQELMRKHLLNANNHPYRFNDHPLFLGEKKSGTRIIILGDSFVFGDGVESHHRWSSIFEKHLNEKGNYEVLHWGQCGWNTVDQADFLQSRFLNKSSIHHADFLILGLVDNDPDRFHSFKELDLASLIRCPFLNKLFPSFFRNLNHGIQYILLNHLIGYEAWKRKTYSSSNLREFQKEILKIKDLLESKNINFMIFLTFDPDQGGFELSKKIEPLLKELNVEYYNPTGILYSKYKGRQFWVSPANAHPSSELHKDYGTLLFKFLIKNKIFEKLP